MQDDEVSPVLRSQTTEMSGNLSPLRLECKQVALPHDSGGRAAQGAHHSDVFDRLFANETIFQISKSKASGKESEFMSLVGSNIKLIEIDDIDRPDGVDCVWTSMRRQVARPYLQLLPFQ